MKKIKATAIKSDFHRNILFYNYTKKGGFMQPTFVTQARHQFFDWKLETRRERVPSAPARTFIVPYLAGT
jgi:hypothetical protein